jgi:hypothetical protein
MSQKQFPALIDRDALKQAMESTTGKPQSERITAIVRAIARNATPEDLRYVELSRWRNNQIPGVMQRSAQTLPFAASILGAVLQVVAVHKLNEDLEKSAITGVGRNEAQARLIGGSMTLTAAAAGVLEKGQARWPSVTMRFGQGTHDLLTNLFKGGSRGLGFVGGMIFAVCDGWKAYEVGREGQAGLAIAYGASSIVGGISAFLILWNGFALATGVGIVLVILAVALSVLISFLKDNPVQVWLEGCRFGKNIHNDLSLEMRALQAAMA